MSPLPALIGSLNVSTSAVPTATPSELSAVLALISVGPAVSTAWASSE